MNQKGFQHLLIMAGIFLILLLSSVGLYIWLASKTEKSYFREGALVKPFPINAGSSFISVGDLPPKLAESSANETAEVVTDLNGGKYVKNQLLVVFKEGTSIHQMDQIISKYQGRPVGREAELLWVQVRFQDGNDLIDLIRKFQSHPEVDYASLSHISELF